MAVVVPRSQLGRLASLPGVDRVYPSVRYRTQLDRSPQQIGAPALWGPGLTTAGQGMKIAIIDEGIDQTHPFFSPAGYTMPAGYPKGQTAYTNAKVIVARAFPPARPVWKHAAKPFDPELSSHGTHVAGIAAGNANTLAEGARISGVAPRAYLGNYKALTIPTDADVGLDGNSPELVAAIEAAVADGMDVINMSLGEPEIEPSRDIVVQALAAAARAGVVSVVAAGNDYADFGRGSVGSPGSSPEAITVGAVTTTRSGADDVVASFSSSGPTPLSLRLKPEVSAPGVSILSAAPGASRTRRCPGPAWPHRTSRERSRSCSSATRPGRPLRSSRRSRSRATRRSRTTSSRRSSRPCAAAAASSTCRAPTTRSSSRRPSRSRSGSSGPGANVTQSVELTDAGGGAGAWTVTVERQTAATGVTLSVAADRDRPRPAARVRHDDDRARRRALRLHRPHARRRAAPDPLLVPHGRARARQRRHGPRCAAPASTPRRRRAAPAASRATAIPSARPGFGFATELPGPERVFRVTLARPATNFGVVVTSRAKNVRVEPRIVLAGDERRLTGYAALPFNLNPYLRTFGDPVLAAGTILPAAGAYDVVFDSPSAASAGAFSFRYWLNDTTPPSRRAPDEVRQARRAARRRRLRPRRRRRSGLARREGRRRGAARPLRRRTGAHLDRGPRARASTCSGSRSPTTRRRGTWRTSARSCRTRASSRRPSSVRLARNPGVRRPLARRYGPVTTLRERPSQANGQGGNDAPLPVGGHARRRRAGCRHAGPRRRRGRARRLGIRGLGRRPVEHERDDERRDDPRLRRQEPRRAGRVARSEPERIDLGAPRSHSASRRPARRPSARTCSSSTPPSRTASSRSSRPGTSSSSTRTSGRRSPASTSASRRTRPCRRRTSRTSSSRTRTGSCCSGSRPTTRRTRSRSSRAPRSTSRTGRRRRERRGRIPCSGRTTRPSARSSTRRAGSRS